jgi:hypothetical protein
VIYVYNKARWSTVANKDCLCLLICYIPNWRCQKITEYSRDEVFTALQILNVVLRVTVLQESLLTYTVWPQYEWNTVPGLGAILRWAPFWDSCNIRKMRGQGCYCSCLCGFIWQAKLCRCVKNPGSWQTKDLKLECFKTSKSLRSKRSFQSAYQVIQY